jgi:hypothetical protein
MGATVRTKHDSPRAVIRVQKCHLDMASRPELHACWRAERQRLLHKPLEIKHALEVQ